MTLSESEATTIVLAATQRATLPDALLWLAEGRRLAVDARIDEVLAATACLQHVTNGEAALRTLCRTALSSGVDPSSDLLAIDLVERPESYRRALDEVARYTSTGSIAQISIEAVAYAVDRDNFVMTALGQVAGLAWRDLRDRVGVRTDVVLPSEPEGPWVHEQVAAAFSIIDSIVSGTEEARLAGAVPARPVELMFRGSDSDGWEAVAQYLENGVPFEQVLVQRAVGGAWLSHRNATSGQVSSAVAEEVCAALDTSRIPYVRGKRVGGSADAKALRLLLGSKPEQIGVVVTNSSGAAVLAIAFSAARDGGSARKSAGRLSKLPPNIGRPCAVVVVGQGWADRGESRELVEAFQGRVYTERSLAALIAVAEELIRNED